MSILASLFVVVLFIGNIGAGSWYFKRVMPVAKNRLEKRLGVDIDYNMFTGFWCVSENESLDDQKKYELRVTFYHFLFVSFFVVCMLLQIALIILVAYVITRKST